MTAEYASGTRSSRKAFESLAARSGLPLHQIVALAEENRLNELFDEYGHIGRPLTPAEALRRLDAKRYGPGDEKPPSPAAALGHLRARMAEWDAEAAAHERAASANSHRRLGEIRAAEIPSWWGQ